MVMQEASTMMSASAMKPGSLTPVHDGHVPQEGRAQGTNPMGVAPMETQSAVPSSKPINIGANTTQPKVSG